MDTLLWLGLAALVGGIVAMNVVTRRADKARKARGEKPLDDETWIW